MHSVKCRCVSISEPVRPLYSLCYCWAPFSRNTLNFCLNFLLFQVAFVTFFSLSILGGGAKRNCVVDIWTSSKWLEKVFCLTNGQNLDPRKVRQNWENFFPFCTQNGKLVCIFGSILDSSSERLKITFLSQVDSFIPFAIAEPLFPGTHWNSA